MLSGGKSGGLNKSLWIALRSLIHSLCRINPGWIGLGWIGLASSADAS